MGKDALSWWIKYQIAPRCLSNAFEHDKIFRTSRETLGRKVPLKRSLWLIRRLPDAVDAVARAPTLPQSR